jgi:hypothetical protein
LKRTTAALTYLSEHGVVVPVVRRGRVEQFVGVPTYEIRVGAYGDQLGRGDGSTPIQREK